MPEPERRPEARKGKAAERPSAVRRFLPAALIVAAALVAYAPVLRAGFVWDDGVFLTENPLIRASDGLHRFWFTTQQMDYMPLTSSVLWFEWRLWGPHATGFHIVNVLLHAASAVLLWRVLLRLKVPGAWLAGLLFALHPVAVQSVAWITERKNTLSMVLYLGSILAYLRFEDARFHHDVTTGRTKGIPRSALHTPHSALRTSHYLLSLGLFLLALLAKTSVVMLPVILLLLAWWRRGKLAWKNLLRTVPFFALSLALGLVTMWFQWHQWHQGHNSGVHQMASPDAASRVAAAGLIAWFYLYKILLPAGLCAIYPNWSAVGSSVLSFLPILLLAAATALLWTRRKRWGAGPLVAWAYFLVSLLPVLGFVHMSFMSLMSTMVADHLQYTAMPGILALAAALLARAAARGRAGRAAVVIVVICLAAMGALTFRRAGIFENSQLLWADSIEKNPGSAVAWYALGTARLEVRALPEAIHCFSESLKLNPEYVVAYDNRGVAYYYTGRYQEAIRDFGNAIALKPDDADAYSNRAIADYAVKDYPRALSDVNSAQRLGAHPPPDFLRDLAKVAGRPNPALSPAP
jgi:tetratricopeptide (TPR) repeat protein